MRWRSLGVLAVVALMPKCIACVAAYLAAGAGFVAIGREWCGGEGDSGGAIAWMASDAWVYAWLAVLGGMALVRRARWRRGKA